MLTSFLSLYLLITKIKTTMKNYFTLFLIIFLTANTGLFSQENADRNAQRLEQIEAEIQYYQDRQQTAKYLLIGGGACYIGAFLLDSPQAFNVLLLSGSILGTWGGYRWWDASNNISRLNAAKYSFNIDYEPVMLPHSSLQAGVPSLKLVINF